MNQELKIILVRFGRVTLSAFVFTAIAFLYSFHDSQMIIDAFKVSIGNGFATIGMMILLPLVSSACVGAASAGAKFLRENRDLITNKILEVIAKIF